MKLSITSKFNENVDSYNRKFCFHCEQVIQLGTVLDIMLMDAMRLNAKKTMNNITEQPSQLYKSKKAHFIL